MVTGAVAHPAATPEPEATPSPHAALQNAGQPMRSISTVCRVQRHGSDREDVAGCRGRCWREYTVAKDHADSPESDATFVARPPDHAGFGQTGRTATWYSEKDEWTLLTSYPT
jgi:hypothetical protein